MSAELMGKVWSLDLSHGKQVVMLALADHAHDDGTHCYPGIPYLAWKTGYSERNVTRILGELEDDEIIESQDEKSGGYGLYSEYHIHIEKGDKKPEFHRKSNPKRVTTQTAGEPERVTNGTEKGDNSAQNPDNPDKKGDNSPRAKREEPSENHKEPSVEGAAPTETVIPDDTTTTCLKTLLDIRGFPRDQGENALKLAEYRKEFPNADPVEVCRDFRAYSEETRKKPTRLRLRNFFKQAAKRPDNVRPFRPSETRSPKPPAQSYNGLFERDKKRRAGG
jgi:hypothetical protein